MKNLIDHKLLINLLDDELCYFACACSRQVFEKMLPFTQEKIIKAELYLIGKEEFDRRGFVFTEGYTELIVRNLIDVIMSWATTDSYSHRLYHVLSIISLVKEFSSNSDAVRKEQLEIFNDICRPKICPKIKFLDEWISKDVREIAKEIHYEKKKLHGILADCLYDNGCNNLTILDHLRQIDKHYFGCWIVREILEIEKWTK